MRVHVSLLTPERSACSSHSRMSQKTQNRKSLALTMIHISA